MNTEYPLWATFWSVWEDLVTSGAPARLSSYYNHIRSCLCAILWHYASAWKPAMYCEQNKRTDPRWPTHLFFSPLVPNSLPRTIHFEPILDIALTFLVFQTRSQTRSALWISSRKRRRFHPLLSNFFFFWALIVSTIFHHFQSPDLRWRKANSTYGGHVP
jgi:hypothetical protein